MCKVLLQQVVMQKIAFIQIINVIEDDYTKWVFIIDEAALYWNEMPSSTFIAREKSMSGLRTCREGRCSC